MSKLGLQALLGTAVVGVSGLERIAASDLHASATKRASRQSSAETLRRPSNTGELMSGCLDLGLILTRCDFASCRPTHGVCHALLSAHVYRMLTGSCNPTLCRFTPVGPKRLSRLPWPTAPTPAGT